MTIAALPEYIARRDLTEASPGMRFGIYLPIWVERADQERYVREAARKRSPQAKELKGILENQGMDAAIGHMQRRQRSFPRLWNLDKRASHRIWREVTKLGEADLLCVEALVDRQELLASAARAGEAMLTLDARAIAPFTTGLGNEHPLENGFSFLWPYGLPYLPGSGVKGVLRQAARELAPDVGLEGIADWGGAADWGSEAIDILFGSEDESAPRRGVLSFWDVIPRISGRNLAVEVMTGHQKHYFQDGRSPHESGQPNPIRFLTLPPGSRFTFHVACNEPFLRRIAPGLAEGGRWKTLLEQAFRHAFDWLGFGAKTAVGYGAMEADPRGAEDRAERREAAEKQAIKAARNREREAQLRQMPPLQREVEEFNTILEAINALTAEYWGEQQAEAAAFIRERMLREGCWIEQSRKKRPDKDKPHQRTLLVKQYLE